MAWKLRQMFVFMMVVGLSGTSFGSPGKIHIYKFDIENATVQEGQEISQVIAAELAKVPGFKKNCIDLRTLGSSSEHDPKLDYDKIKRASVGVVVNEPLDLNTIKSIRKAVCPKFPADDCSLFFSAQTVDSSRVNFMANLTSTDDQPYLRRQGYSLKSLNGRLPPLSKACQTGKNVDSWNDAAGTFEGIQFLNNNGVDLSQARTLNLEVSGPNQEDNTLWTFGFPSETTKRLVNGKSGGRQVPETKPVSGRQ